MSTATGWLAGSAQGHAARADRAGAAAGHGWVVDVVRREGPAIARLLWRLLGHEADVMDAYQDCFCRLATARLPSDVRSVRAYVFRMATNTAIEMLRVRKRRAAHWPAIVDSRAGARTTNEPAGSEHASAERLARLREAIARLPEHLRNVVTLRDLARMPYEEVGRTLGIEPTTARVYRRHAVVRLMELMDEGAGHERG